MNIPNYDELAMISQFIAEQKINTEKLSLVITLDNEEEMKRVNEDYYYKLYGNDSNMDIKENEPTEINVNIGKLKCRYILNENNQEYSN